jgi:prepilin-type N-terminal cleavage/methylation domain-containing protein
VRARRWPGPGRSGFTFIELVVALVVLVVGMLGLSASASLVAAQLRVARLEARVRVEAQAELEALLAGGADPQLAGQERHHDLFTTTIEVVGDDPRALSVTVAGNLGVDTVADTLVTLVRSR